MALPTLFHQLKISSQQRNVQTTSSETCVRRPPLSRWWCPSPCLAGGVRLFVCLSSFVSWLVMSGSPDVSLHLSPLICPQFAFLDVCLYLSLSICFPVCLVLLGSLGYLSLLVSRHLSSPWLVVSGFFNVSLPILSSGVRLSRCFFFACTCLSSFVSRNVSLN